MLILINEKEIPGVWLIFTSQELKPKGEANSSFLVLHPSSGVHTFKTVGSHLKLVSQYKTPLTGYLETNLKTASSSSMFTISKGHDGSLR